MVPLCGLDGAIIHTDGFTSSADPIEAFLILFCGPGTVTHNDLFIRFKAESNFVKFAISPSCLKEGHCIGIQAAIIETDCIQGATYSTTLSCANCKTTDFELEANVVAGQEYFLMLDGCCGDVCDVTFEVISEHEEPELNINEPSSICNESPVILNASFSIPEVSGIFLWTTENGHIVGDSTNESIAVDKAGIYTATATNIIYCTVSELTKSVEVFEGESPIITTDEIVELESESAILYSNFEGNPTYHYFYWWYDSDGSQIAFQKDSIIVDEIGDYTFIVKNIDTKCADTVMVSVVNCLENISLTGNTVITCIEPTTTISADITGAYTYQWLNENGDIISTDLSVTFDESGTYSFIVSDVNGGCEKEEQITISSDLDIPDLVASGGVLTCTDVSTTLTASSTTSNPSFEWTDSNGNQIGNGASIDVVALSDYTVVVTNQDNGCTASKIVQVIPDMDAPSAMISINGANSVFSCGVDKISLQAVTDVQNASFEWSGPFGNMNGQVVDAFSPGP